MGFSSPGHPSPLLLGSSCVGIQEAISTLPPTSCTQPGALLPPTAQNHLVWQKHPQTQPLLVLTSSPPTRSGTLFLCPKFWGFIALSIPNKEIKRNSKEAESKTRKPEFEPHLCHFLPCDLGPIAFFYGTQFPHLQNRPPNTYLAKLLYQSNEITVTARVPRAHSAPRAILNRVCVYSYDHKSLSRVGA